MSAVGQLRTRSFSWEDPAAAAAAGVEPRHVPSSERSNQ
jgi:hypothetical protein